MPDIVHRVGVEVPATRVFDALATPAGLAGWWTAQTEAEPRVGARLRFRFGAGGPDMEITAPERPSLVRWRCVSGPAEWVGTELFFGLREEDGETIVLFAQRHWREEVEFMAHCSTKWAYYLLSPKALVERGQGTPFPHDAKLSRWVASPVASETIARMGP